jgi:hypothetical protein
MAPYLPGKNGLGTGAASTGLHRNLYLPVYLFMGILRRKAGMLSNIPSSLSSKLLFFLKALGSGK